MTKRCVICGRVKVEPGYAGDSAICVCNWPDMMTHTTGYPLVVIRADQYQEIIDRLARIEALVKAKA